LITKSYDAASWSYKYKQYYNTLYNDYTKSDKTTASQRTRALNTANNVYAGLFAKYDVLEDIKFTIQLPGSTD
jgi:hypothetical protein